MQQPVLHWLSHFAHFITLPKWDTSWLPRHLTGVAASPLRLPGSAKAV
ncbi:hypothetical protein [Aeromonas veronii]|nr:hypothetical protein [Aeromonas veronii]QLH66971.1 hypothetical protein HXV88_11165 [Aeromonas veronii]